MSRKSMIPVAEARMFDFRMKEDEYWGLSRSCLCDIHNVKWNKFLEINFLSSHRGKGSVGSLFTLCVGRIVRRRLDILPKMATILYTHHIFSYIHRKKSSLWVDGESTGTQFNSHCPSFLLGARYFMAKWFRSPVALYLHSEYLGPIAVIFDHPVWTAKYALHETIDPL
jgi:hypothetical protein